jgi:hypothetical protein
MGLFFCVCEVHLLMQIIINRTAVIVDDRRLMAKIKVQKPHMYYTRHVQVLTVSIVGYRYPHNLCSNRCILHLDSSSFDIRQPNV